VVSRQARAHVVLALTVNDRFEFPMDLDLTDFLKPREPEGPSATTPAAGAAAASAEPTTAAAADKPAEGVGEQPSDDLGKRAGPAEGEDGASHKRHRTDEAGDVKSGAAAEGGDAAKEQQEQQKQQQQEETKAAAGSPAPRYVLQSVLIHQGSTFGGHYVAFIRPIVRPRPREDGAAPTARDCMGGWIKYDDDRVYQASGTPGRAARALRESSRLSRARARTAQVDQAVVETTSFGGPYLSRVLANGCGVACALRSRAAVRQQRAARSKRAVGGVLSSSNAYMLVYIREDEALAAAAALPVDVPPSVSARIERGAEGCVQTRLRGCVRQRHLHRGRGREGARARAVRRAELHAAAGALGLLCSQRGLSLFLPQEKPTHFRVLRL
jgi:hypothetical protein